MTDTAIDRKRAELLERQLRLRRRKAADSDRIDPVSRTGPLRLSRLQEGLWLAAKLSGDDSFYNMPFAMWLSGPLDVARLRTALELLTARHESLRTAFTDDDGSPVLTLAPAPGPVWFEQTDLTGVPAADRRAHAVALAEAQLGQPFELSRPPLLRSWLARLDDDEHLFQFVVHHIVCDGWSIPIIASELAEFYNAAGQGREPRLAPLPVQPIDVDAWQRDGPRAAQLPDRLAYWRRQLADLPHLNYPTDRPRNATASYHGNSVCIDLPTETIRRADAAASTAQIMPFAVMLAAFAMVLRDRSGQDDLAIGSVFSGRVRTELEPLVGYFANAQVLRVRLSPDDIVSDVIGHCHQLLLDAQQLQDIPFSDVVDAVRPERIPGANPMFQICFTLARGGVTGQGAMTLDGIETSGLDILQGGSRFDLTFQVTERGGHRFVMLVEYSTDLFDLAGIERLASGFRSILNEILPARGFSGETVETVRRAALGPDSVAPDHPAAPSTGQGAVPSDQPALSDADTRALIRDELVEIWTEVFELEPTEWSDDDSFFEIGGTSILAVRLRTRISESFGADVSLADIFAGGSIAELVESIIAALGAQEEM